MSIVISTRAILVIAGISALCLCSLISGLYFTSEASQAGGSSAKDNFHWNWKNRQELSREQSLRKAKVTLQRKKLIASAIMEQLRPLMADLEIQSEQELEKVAFDTRVKMIDLNGDGVPEVVAQGQGMGLCGATGNCPFWIFRKVGRRYELILNEGAQTFTIQKSGARFADIILSSHSSASSGGLAHYQYRDGVYERVGCYEYDWTSWEDDGIHELKEPRITPCVE